MNMNISQLKNIIADLPDDMPVVIPVIDEDDCNTILAFGHVRTAGIISCRWETGTNKTVLCLNAASDQDIADQIYFSGRDVYVNKVLFGESKIIKQKI